MPLTRSHGSYGHVGERRGSLGQRPIRILRPGRLEVGLSVRRQPIEIRHPKRLAQRPGLSQRPIIIQHSRRLTQRPGRGQRPMIIRRSLEIGLEPAGQGRVPQWSIPGPSCVHSIHSIPDSGPIRIQYADLTRTTLNSGVYINRSSQASSRITPIDLVETPSPDLASPHLLFSDLIETPSLDRPLGMHLSGNRSLTDPQREQRIAGGLRPGLVLPHPLAACPDTRLDLDAAPPEAAAISRAERPPTVVDIP